MSIKRLGLAFILFGCGALVLLRAAYPVTFGWLGFLPLAWAPFLFDGLLLLGFIALAIGLAADRDLGLTMCTGFFLYIALGIGIRFAGGAAAGESLPPSIDRWFVAALTWPSWLVPYIYHGLWPR
jgi:hypothetical protein